MSLDPQCGGAWRSRWWLLAGLVLVASGWGARPAKADIYVHVVNCTDSKMTADAFDAKDSTELVAASTATFPSGEPGHSEQLHCAGEGKGYCKVQITLATPASACDQQPAAGYKLDSGTYSVVTGYSKTEGVCSLVITENLDSAPSCSN
jgi:hypothetical protein